MQQTIEQALVAFGQAGILLPADLLARLEGVQVRTIGYFTGVLEQWTRNLYNGRVSEYDFVSKLADLIAQQLTRAWNEGMRVNGLDPVQDMLPEYQAKLQDIIANEYAYVDGFAAEVARGKAGGAPLEGFLVRARMWGNRYTDVVNQAILFTADAKNRLVWVFGDTEHCDTCARLNGLVATAKEWEASGVRPQSPPNHVLECGGWRCQCRLEPTTRRRSPNVRERLASIAAVYHG